MTIDIEKLADECGAYIATEDQGETPFMTRGEMIFDAESLYNFAESYAAKVLEDKEREIVELKSHIEELRKFIYWECDVYLNGQNSEFSKKYRELLAKTPAQSMQEHDNEVIEKCATVADTIFDDKESYTGQQIRALKVNNA